MSRGDGPYTHGLSASGPGLTWEQAELLAMRESTRAYLEPRP